MEIALLSELLALPSASTVEIFLPYAASSAPELLACPLRRGSLVYKPYLHTVEHCSRSQEALYPRQQP